MRLRNPNIGAVAVLAQALVSILVLAGCSGPTTPEPQPLELAATLSIDSVATLGGRNVEVPIRLTYPGDPSEQLDQFGGFEIFLEYDASVLMLVNAKKGSDVSSWEYWTWRTYAVAGGRNAELGALRIVSIRDMNNGVAPDPPQYYPEGAIGTITYYVTADQGFINTCTEIWFRLADCNDNVLSWGYPTKTLCMPDMSLGNPSIAESYSPAECRYYDSVSASVELRGGKVCILEPPDDRGCDIDGDGAPNTISDAILYMRYFTEGPSVLGAPWSPYFNSDCNCDDEDPSLADCEFLIRSARCESGGLEPAPYSTSATLDISLQDDVWVCGISSNSYVSAFWIEMTTPTGQRPRVEWHGDDAVVLGYHQKWWLNTLRILVYRWFEPPDSSPTDWPGALRIYQLDADSLEIHAVQASTYPGSTMVVNVVQ